MTAGHPWPPAMRRPILAAIRRYALLLLVLASAGCEAGRPDNNGEGGMFGFFRGSKPSRSTTTEVAAEVGATLVAAPSFPVAEPAPPPVSEFGSCREMAMEGVPPDAKLVNEQIRNQTTTAYRIDGMAGQPALVLANIGGAHPRIDLWELGDSERFAAQRPVLLESAQRKWVGFLLQDVACLPQRRLLLAVFYNEPEPRDALYVYDVADKAFTPLGRIAPDPQHLHSFFEVRPLSADTAVVRYSSDVRRQGPERYLNLYNHLRLYSPRYPQGLALLKLGIDDGNIERWMIVGKTLLLDTVDARDARQPKHHIWTLDLSKVL